MQRKKKGRVNGPYKDRRGWRVVMVLATGERESRIFAAEAQAEAFAKGAREALEERVITVGEAIDRFRDQMVRDGVQEHSARGIINSVRLILVDPDEMLVDIDAQLAQRMYDAARERRTQKGRTPTAATHRKALSRTRALMRWAIKNEHLTSDPFEAVEAKGKVNRGKRQLTRDQARALTRICFQAGTPDATAVLVCLWMGLRGGEVARITRDCLDDGGRLLHVPGTKTKNARRLLAVPDALVPLLPALADHRPRCRKDAGWVNRAVKLWCDEAGIPRLDNEKREACAQGLRGTHSSLAAVAGATSELIASSLGHGSIAVTEGHYIDPNARQQRQQDAVTKVLSSAEVPQGTPEALN